MPEMQTAKSEDVLTLAEAAAYLRVPEAELLRLLTKLSTEKSVTERGSKQAVLKYFGVFKDDDDLDEVLADIRTRRKAVGG
jgi:hypothetical protein